MIAPEIKTWRLYSYSDPLTGALALEVVPNDDLREHEFSPECVCLPQMESEDGALMLIHNAFDGRKFSEANYRERVTE